MCGMARLLQGDFMQFEIPSCHARGWGLKESELEASSKNLTLMLINKKKITSGWYNIILCHSCQFLLNVICQGIVSDVS